MNYESVFRQRLMKKIVELQEERTRFLLGGIHLGAAVPDPATLGLLYAKSVAYLQALDDVYRLCEVVHDELNQS